MAGQLIPPPELDPKSGKSLSFEQRISAWVDLLKLGDQFVLAGLRHRLGTETDLETAYREWYERKMEEHDRMMLQMLKEFDRRQRHHDQ
jgi:hypothetical protein